MGLLFNDNEAIKKEVEEKFGAQAKYLFAMKHNGPVKSTLKLFLLDGLYAYEANRTFVLVFDKKGIYEKEISNSDKKEFYLYPESEIENFEVHREAKKATIHFLHIGKSIAYEIPFRGRLFSENEDQFNGLEMANWQQI